MCCSPAALRETPPAPPVTLLLYPVVNISKLQRPPQQQRLPLPQLQLKVKSREIMIFMSFLTFTIKGMFDSEREDKIACFTMFINNILFPGLIISGGSNSSQSVEVFVPSTGQQCQLPSLPAGRYDHSMEARTVCGGYYSYDTLTSCFTLTDGSWERSTTLLEFR